MLYNSTKWEEIYKVGDSFHNDNGETYTVVAINPEKDIAILSKLTHSAVEALDKRAFYVGISGIGPHHWAHGHYFMENLSAAVEWFANDGKPAKEDEDEVKEPVYVACISNQEHFWHGCKGPFKTWLDALEDVRHDMEAFYETVKGSNTAMNEALHTITIYTPHHRPTVYRWVIFCTVKENLPILPKSPN